MIGRTKVMTYLSELPGPMVSDMVSFALGFWMVLKKHQGEGSRKTNAASLR